MTSATTENPKVQALRQLGRDRGYSDAEINAKLQEAGLIDQPSLMGQMGHAAGLIGRMALQGVGNLASLPFGLAGAAVQAATGRPAPAILQGQQGTAAANQMGLPQPQGAGERVATAAGENAIGAAILPGATGPMAALGAASGAAGQTAAEAGAGPMGQLAASAAVGIGVPVVATFGAAAIRSAIAGAASRRQAAQQAMALIQAGDPNAPVTLGQVATGGLARTMEGGLRNVPGAANTFKGTLSAQGERLGERATRIADQISPGGTPTSAGAAIQRGIREGFVPKFRATAAKLYNRVFQQVPPDTPIIPGKTVQLFAEQNNLVGSARPLSDNLASPTMQRWADQFAETLQQNPNGIPFNVLKEFRSRLGEMLSGGDLVEGISLRDAKRLYGTLSDDMTQAIAQNGGPGALNDWNQAQRFWQFGTDRLEKILQPLIDKAVPEKAFAAVMSGTREGASVLRASMRALRPDERGLVTSTVIRRMGAANPSAQDALGAVFSPETFLTRWNQLAPEAKAALFESTDPLLVKDLNRLAQATSLIRQANRVLPNPSGTASNNAFMAIISGLSAAGGGVLTGSMGGAGISAALGPMAAAGAGKIAAEKVFTNPRMIRWLVRQTTVPAQAIGQELALLAKDSQKWPEEDRSVAQELTDSFSNIDWNQVMLARAVADAAR